MDGNRCHASKREYLCYTCLNLNLFIFAVRVECGLTIAAILSTRVMEKIKNIYLI